jgi:colicin import membrane protein
LQPYPNKHISKFPSEKRKGIVGTTILHLLLFVLLIVVGFTTEPPKSEEGIMVNFGTDETGLGMIEPSPPAVQEKTSPPAVQEKTSPPVPPKTAVKTEEDPLLSQNTEEAPEVKKADAEAKKKKLEKIEANKKIKEQIEAERVQKVQEEIERKRVEAEQKRQSDIMNRTKNALANSRNAGTNSTSEGIAGGPGNQGSLSGSVDSKVRGEGGGHGDKGKSFDLQGRGILKFPDPKYIDYQEEGKVVVEVSVDTQGKVIKAVPGVKGSTTLNEDLLKVAKNAALEASFEVKKDAPAVQKGTITYNFVLK